MCPTGYSSISDFICCNPSSINDCLTTIPRTKPCIADQCLTQCGWYIYDSELFLDHTVYIVTYGNPQYGHPSLYESPAFLRYLSADEDANDQSLAKCLRFHCLEYSV